MSIKSVITSNKSVIKFLLVFFGSYAILALLYQGFLKYNTFKNYYPDYITHQVAYQSHYTIDLLGYDVSISKSQEHPSMMLSIDNQNVTRVIEGCNSISVIILFMSFILAFYKGLKSTLLYIILGSLLIYILNVIRVALLTIGLYKYPEYNKIMHDILFPLCIYGLVLLLWLLWIKNYTKPQSN